MWTIKLSSCSSSLPRPIRWNRSFNHNLPPTMIELLLFTCQIIIIIIWFNLRPLDLTRANNITTRHDARLITKLGQLSDENTHMRYSESTPSIQTIRALIPSSQSLVLISSHLNSLWLEELLHIRIWPNYNKTTMFLQLPLSDTASQH